MTRRRLVAGVVCAVLGAGFSWALSGVGPAGAQANGVPDEKTLEDELTKKKPPAPKPIPKRANGAAAVTGISKPAPGHKPILLIVESDAACTLEVNGDPVSVLKPSTAKKLPVPPGDQLVKCVSTEEPSEVYSEVQNLKPGEQKVVEIGLAARIETIRQKRTENTQRVADEDAIWSKASAGGTAADLQGYLDGFPEGRHAAEAKAALVELTHGSLDDADWQQVANSTRLQAVQGYIDKYPSGRHLDAAQQRRSFVSRLPPRPTLPFTLSEDIWEALENSAYYGGLPRRSHAVTIQMSIKMASQPPKGSTSTWTQVTTRKIAPLGDRCAVIQTESRRSEPNDAPSESVEDYRCGALSLATVNNGTVTRTASLSDVTAFVADDQARRDKPSCELETGVPANSFNASLTGTATRYGCAAGDYYFGDLGVWLSELGTLDSAKQAYVVPNSGYVVETAPDGGAGGRTSALYERYSWTITN